MFKVPIPIPNHTSKLEDLLAFSSVGFSSDIEPNTFVRYMSEYEEKTSKVLDNDWDYYLNYYGFRGPWRLEDSTKKIGFFGCSVTFGIGVHHTNIFPTLVENNLGIDKVESINLGMGGSSIQRIAKLVSATTNVLELDAVVLTLPPFYRFLVLNKDNLMIDILPGFYRENCENIQKFLYGKSFGQNNLESIYIDYVHWIISELKPVKRVLWSSWDNETYNLLKTIIDKENLLPAFAMVDEARDKHPGIQSHKMYASHICKKLKDL